MTTEATSTSDFNERSIVVYCWSIPKRYVQAILACLALFVVNWMKTVFSVAYFHKLPYGYSGMVEWPFYEASWIELVHVCGFAAAQIPGALLTIKFLPHRVLLVSMALATLFHAILPWTFSGSAPWVITVWLLQGIAEGPIYPACAAIWKSWAPPSERTRLFSIVLCGAIFGSVAGLPINTLLVYYFGMKACFFLSNVSGLIWCLLWSTQIYERPSDHPHISQSELTYLEENVSEDSNLEVTVKSVPWKSILVSMPVWVICMANICYNFSNTFLILSTMFYPSELGTQPGYVFFRILLPDIVLGVVVVVSGIFADLLINKAHMSRNIVRKLFCSGALTLHGVVFLILKYYQNTIEICLHFAHGFLGLSITGFMVNCLDLSSCYSSVVMALCQTFVATSYIVFSWVTGSIPINIVISMSFIVAVAYGIFGSGNLQRWAKPERSCIGTVDNDLSRSTYYSYPDGEDCVELVTERDYSSNAFSEMEKERY